MRLPSLFLVAFSLCLAAASSAFSEGSKTIAGFDARFRAVVEKNKVPGAAYAILQEGSIIALGTYGKRRLGGDLPVTEETVFRLASVSKTFTADLAALLVEEGKLSWDAKVVDYVPGFRLKTAGYAEKLKVTHILSHSSGLMPNAYDLMLEDGWSLDKIIPRFKALKPLCQPGKCYGYQNVVFSLIQPVIEKSTGESFENLMESRIFKPLDLENASIGLKPFLASKNHADPHRLTRKGWYRTKVNGDYYAVAPAAGVNASILDLAKWVRAQMGYNKSVLDSRVLAAVTEKRVETKRELWRSGWKSHLSDAYYGYGWRIYELGGEEIIMHAGGVAGFRSLIAYSKKQGIGYVMLMNAESRSIDKLGAAFWVDLFAEVDTETAADSVIAAGR